MSRLKHLEKEIQELIETPTDLEEYVDCFALLMLAMRHEGVSLSDLYEGMEGKLITNKLRKWGKVNEDGFVEHIRAVWTGGDDD